LKIQNKKLVNIIGLIVLSLNIACQADTTVIVSQAPGKTGTTGINQNKASAVPKATASPSKLPGEPDENEIVGTDTEAVKTNISWKDYNPVIKGKKYTYVYTIKDSSSTVQADILREITEVEDKTYKFRQTILTSGKDAKLSSTEISIQLNNDFSPPIIPPNSVGGVSITPVAKVEITEKPEKVKVPLKEFDAIKVTAVLGESVTTNWYAKDTGLIKAVQASKTETHTLELKEYK
jgi:hypothetical protein